MATEDAYENLAQFYAPDSLRYLDSSVGNMKIAKAMYESNNLPYHNMAHIKHMLKLVPDEIKNEPGIKALTSAIVWHDAVYVPGDSVNESQSVYFYLAHNANESDEMKELVTSLIMATRDHSLTVAATPKIDTHLMMHEVIIDLDLYNLGGRWQDYLGFGKLIRKEYYAFADEEFMEGRLKFLEKYLNRPSVYLSGFFLERENDALRNMEKEHYMIERMGKLPYEG